MLSMCFAYLLLYPGAAGGGASSRGLCHHASNSNIFIHTNNITIYTF